MQHTCVAFNPEQGCTYQIRILKALRWFEIRREDDSGCKRFRQIALLSAQSCGREGQDCSRNRQWPHLKDISGLGGRCPP